MFTEETLNGKKRQVREKGSDEETEVIRNKAIKLKLFIYNKAIHDSIIKQLKANAKRPPAIVIAKITAEIMTKFEKDGGKIINDPDVLEGLSKMLIRELMTIAVVAEVLPEDKVNGDTVFRIVGLAQAEWDKLNPDRVDKNRAARLMEKGRQDPEVAAAVSRQAQEQSIQSVDRQPGSDQQMPAAMPPGAPPEQM